MGSCFGTGVGTNSFLTDTSSRRPQYVAGMCAADYNLGVTGGDALSDTYTTFYSSN
jgi:hypothetical protein